jgi:hypothetical protein
MLQLHAPYSACAEMYKIIWPNRPDKAVYCSGLYISMLPTHSSRFLHRISEQGVLPELLPSHQLAAQVECLMSSMYVQEGSAK